MDIFEETENCVTRRRRGRKREVFHAFPDSEIYNTAVSTTTPWSWGFSRLPFHQTVAVSCNSYQVKGPLPAYLFSIQDVQHCRTSLYREFETIIAQKSFPVFPIRQHRRTTQQRAHSPTAPKAATPRSTSRTI